MSARQECPLCGEQSLVLVTVEGYGPSCPSCLVGQGEYHMANVHDPDCGRECAEQLAALEQVRRRLAPGRRRTSMLVRLRADGGAHDEVVLRSDDDDRLGDELRTLGLTPAIVERTGATYLGRGADGAEYEVHRL